jgi:hypothetical protein
VTSGNPLTDEQKEEILKKIPTTLIAEIARELKDKKGQSLNTYTISKFLRTTYENRRKELIQEGVSYPIADDKAYREIYYGEKE